jgi:hypothetical protein
MSQGLGGVSIMIDEGLSAFHNPAIYQSKKVNFTISRWLYATHLFSMGARLQNTVIGINYLNYGSIQGYNEYGVETDKFNPFSICLAVGRKLGPIGIFVKTFEEKIGAYTLYGVCGGMSSYVNFGRFSFGAKIDNIGKEFGQKTELPVTSSFGLHVALRDVDLVLESGFPDFEMHAGLAYTYENVKLLFGAGYLYPQNVIDDDRFDLNLADINFTSGMILQLKKYEVGYSFVYTEFSNSHQLSITLKQ